MEEHKSHSGVGKAFMCSLPVFRSLFLTNKQCISKYLSALILFQCPQIPIRPGVITCTFCPSTGDEVNYLGYSCFLVWLLLQMMSLTVFTRVMMASVYLPKCTLAPAAPGSIRLLTVPCRAGGKLPAAWSQRDLDMVEGWAAWTLSLI